MRKECSRKTDFQSPGILEPLRSSINLLKSVLLLIAVGRMKKAKKKDAPDWMKIIVLDENQINYLTEHAVAGDVLQAEGRVSSSGYKRDGDTVYTTVLIASFTNHFSSAARK